MHCLVQLNGIDLESRDGFVGFIYLWTEGVLTTEEGVFPRLGAFRLTAYATVLGFLLLPQTGAMVSNKGQMEVLGMDVG